MAAKSAACWPVRNSLPTPVLPAKKPLTRPARNPTATSTEVRFISPPLCPHMSPQGLVCQRAAGAPTIDRGQDPYKSHCSPSLICMLTDAPYLRPKSRGSIFGHATIGLKLCDRGGILGNGVGFLEAVCDFNSSDRPGNAVLQRRFGGGANKTGAGIVTNAIAVQKARNDSRQRPNTRSRAQLAGIHPLPHPASRVRRTGRNANR